jgi:predicted protein tyrosine phosphatase
MKKSLFLLLALMLVCFVSVCDCSGLLRASQELAKITAVNDGAKMERTELLNAISVIGDKKEKGASGQIAKLMLTTNDLAVGNACISALSDINEPEAMDAIINFVERKPAIIRRQAIIAARKIANQTAAEWLLVMAYGHDDAMVRKEASEALEVVEEKLGLSKK